MKLGLSSFTYSWAVGVKGYPPAKPMSFMDLIKMTHHFGLSVLCVSLSVGLYTPPVGMTLIISSKIADSSMTKCFKYCIPFMIPEIVLILLLVFIPLLSTGLPSLMFG